MKVDHLLNIHPINVIGSKNGDQIVLFVFDQVDVLMNGVGGAPVPTATGSLLGGDGQDEMIGQNRAESPTLLQVLGQRLRFELSQDIYGIDFGIDEVAEHEVDQTVLASEWDRRLGPVHGEGIEATAFAASHDHAQYIHILSQERPVFPDEFGIK
jgi:hypothetical protein